MLGGDQSGPHCGHVNHVRLPQKLVLKAQHCEDNVLLIPSQQPRGKGELKSWWLATCCSSRQHRRALEWSSTGPWPSDKTWRSCQQKNILNLHDMPPRRNHLGSYNNDLCISTKALLFSTAEYCALIRCRSPHTLKLDVALNNSLRTVSGSLRVTPVNHLPILSGTLQLRYTEKRQSWHSLTRLNVMPTTFSTRHSASLPSVLD